MTWTFDLRTRVRFGPGVIDEAAGHAAGRSLIVTTRGATRRGVADRVISQLERDPVVYAEVEANPTIDRLRDAVTRLRHEPIDSIVAIGGGSAIDTGKVLGLALATPGSTIDALLEPGHAWSDATPIPVTAVPTTAGTGSEVTPFATVWDSVAQVKRSVEGARLHPVVAIVDPELTLTLPWDMTLTSGLDAYTQCFEAVANRRATPMTTALAARGVRLVPDALRRLRTEPSDLGARIQMSEAALLSGVAISHTRTGLAHSMSYPITAHFGMPHGLACGLNLPAVLSFIAESDAGPLATLAEDLGLPDATRLSDMVLRLYSDLDVRSSMARWVPGTASLRPHVNAMITSDRAGNSPGRVDVDRVEDVLDRTAAWFDRGGRQ